MILNIMKYLVYTVILNIFTYFSLTEDLHKGTKECEEKMNNQNFIFRGGGGARKFAYKLTFKPLKDVFTDHSMAFSIEECFF